MDWNPRRTVAAAAAVAGAVVVGGAGWAAAQDDGTTTTPDPAGVGHHAGSATDAPPAGEPHGDRAWSHGDGSGGDATASDARGHGDCPHANDGGPRPGASGRSGSSGSAETSAFRT